MELVITVKADAIIAKLRAMPAVMRAKMKVAIDSITLDMQRSVVLNKLEGQVLRHQTGTLIRSIHIEQAAMRGDGMFGQVYTKQDYGIMWEEGFTRRIGAGARGGPRTLQGKALAKYFERHPPGTREYAARPFLKPVLHEFEERITTDIRRAALEAIRD